MISQARGQTRFWGGKPVARPHKKEFRSFGESQIEMKFPRATVEADFSAASDCRQQGRNRA